MKEASASLFVCITRRVPALVHFAWAYLFLWLLRFGRYQAYLESNFWWLPAMGVVGGALFFLAAMGRPHDKPHGHALARIWLQGVILVLPLLFLQAVHGQTLGAHAVSMRSLQVATGAGGDGQAVAPPAPAKSPSAQTTGSEPLTEPAPSPPKTTAEAEAPPASQPLPDPEPEPANDGSSLTPPPKVTTSIPAGTGRAGPPPKTAKVPPAVKTLTGLLPLVTRWKDYKGKRVATKGAVYGGEGVPPGHILVYRFFISCCVAHAQPVGVLVKTDQAGKLKDDTWVRVEGDFVVPKAIDGQAAPTIRADKVTIIPTPPAKDQYINASAK